MQISARAVLLKENELENFPQKFSSNLKRSEIEENSPKYSISVGRENNYFEKTAKV